MIFLTQKLTFIAFLLLSVGQLFCATNAVIAPKNNLCEDATYIKNVKNWCSSPSQFTTEGATVGNRSPACFILSVEKIQDVWFKFKAIGNIANISVIGNVGQNPKGTLNGPQLGLYRGDCSNLKEVACQSDERDFGIAETFGYDMIIGATYYIQVDGRGFRTGTFQLCINNYNEVPSPSSDCVTGVVLCDKSAFTVESIIGVGKYREDMGQTCLNEEESSAWYKFTCKDAGTLTLLLTPIHPADDLDFVLFMLPNGLEDCSNRIPVRCMASGSNGGHYLEWVRCSGVTGMSERAIDASESPGCDGFDDNFVSPAPLKAGMSYALLIQNFSSTGNGFSLEFGGTSTFVGPKAWFKVSKLKTSIETEMWARDVSTFPGGITKWEWNFGEDAMPKGSKKQGTQKITYSKSGKKSIRLTIETKNGCRVTAIRTITVVKTPPPPKEHEPVEEQLLNEKITDISSDAVLSIEEDTLKKPVLSSPVLEHNGEEDSFTTTEEAVKKEETRTIKKHWRIKRVGILYHKSDSFNIAIGHQEVMNEMVGLLKENSETIAYVEGHTNNIPHDKYCKELSKKRSQAAIDYLMNKGISIDRLTTKLVGKNKPKDTNKSLYGRKRNQRVEVKILYPEEPD